MRGVSILKWSITISYPDLVAVNLLHRSLDAAAIDSVNCILPFFIGRGR